MESQVHDFRGKRTHESSRGKGYNFCYSLSDTVSAVVCIIWVQNKQYKIYLLQTYIYGQNILKFFPNINRLLKVTFVC